MCWALGGVGERKEHLVREDLALQELLGSLVAGEGEQDLHLNWLDQGPWRSGAVGVQRREKSFLLEGPDLRMTFWRRWYWT